MMVNYKKVLFLRFLKIFAPQRYNKKMTYANLYAIFL